MALTENGRKLRMERQRARRAAILAGPNAEAYKEDARERQRRTRAARKARVMDAYGGKCVCCHEDELVFLNIDHIEGGGTAHRKEVRRTGQSFYQWLERNGFPAGFRILCANCNTAYAIQGSCPHVQNSS